jgi:tRNA(Ile)-lysidine synthase
MILVIKKHLNDKFPFLKDSKLLLAVSGGVDSMVMAQVFYSLGYDIALAHVNFQLRGAESDADEMLVTQWANQNNIPNNTTQFDTEKYALRKGISIQMAARELRYQWFETLLQEYGYNYLLTAHHLDDSIETFIINLNRKSGLEGLRGIPEVQNKIVRPFLVFQRSEIEKYAKKNQIVWREDSSNKSLKYERNHIRNKLLPTWEEVNPNFRQDLWASMNHLKESQLLIEDYIQSIKPTFWRKKESYISIDIKHLQKHPHYEQILFQCLKSYHFTDWYAVKNLLDSDSGKQIYSTTHLLLKDRNHILLKEQSPEESTIIPVDNIIHFGNLSYQLNVLTNLSLINFSIPNTEYLDMQNIALPIYLRRWKEGDRFIPLGMKGHKKLSDYFIDLKLPQWEKEKIWLLCDAQDKILWVVGHRIDNRYKITEDTKSYLKISKQSHE